MQMRRAKWWLLYRDEHGRLVQENSGTADAGEARRRLAKAALHVLEARVKEVRRIAYAKEKTPYAKAAAGRTDQGHDHVGDGEKHQRGHRPVRVHETKRRDGKKTHRGGKA
jgi:hypothetical protein